MWKLSQDCNPLIGKTFNSGPPTMKMRQGSISRLQEALFDVWVFTLVPPRIEARNLWRCAEPMKLQRNGNMERESEKWSGEGRVYSTTFNIHRWDGSWMYHLLQKIGWPLDCEKATAILSSALLDPVQGIVCTIELCHHGCPRFTVSEAHLLFQRHFYCMHRSGSVRWCVIDKQSMTSVAGS